MDENVFVVAKNPKPDTRLPYLIKLPVVGEKPVTLACTAEWPSVKDVFCLELDGWPGGAEVIEEVSVQSCRRRGNAIHLVLTRRQRRRSMFVWTKSKGRTLIFWRTQATMRGARPGLKVPQARGLEAPLTIAVDIRERYPWRFKGYPANCVARELPVGDYGLFVDNRLCAVIERKAVSDLLSAALGGTLSFVLSELSQIPYACLLIEGRLSDMFKIEAKVRPSWIMNVIVTLQVAYPQVNWIFGETRELAENFAFRWLAAARKARMNDGYVSYSSEDRAPGVFVVAESAEVSLPVHDRRGRLDEALRLADEGVVWTTAKYAEHFDVNKQTAWTDLSILVKAQALKAEGNRRNRRYVRSEGHVDS